MINNTWYTVAHTSDKECVGRVNFSIGENSLVFDVFIQFGNISISIVSATVEDGTVFSMRVRSQGGMYNVDIRSSSEIASTPTYAVTQVLNSLTATVFDLAGTGQQECIVSTDAYTPIPVSSGWVTLDTIQDITAKKYFTEGLAIGDRDSYFDLTYGDGGVYIGENRIVTVNELASYVTTGSYNSNSKKIELKHGSTVLAEIDASAFIKDGMVDSVSVSNGYLTITFNTDAGKEPITVALTDFFDASNYYTKSDINTLLGGYLPLTGGTITGNLKVNGITELVSALIIPGTAPSSPTSGKVYLWGDANGNYAEDADEGVATVYDLTLKKGSTSLGVYQPGVEAKTIDIADAFSGYALQSISISGDGTYITGGGNLSSNRTLTLSNDVITNLGKAATALQSGSMKALTLKVGTITIGSDYNALSAKTYTISKQNITDTIGSTTYAAYNSAGYLPLSAGSSYPLTNTLYLRALLPTTTATYDIGSSTYKFKNLYLSGTANADDIIGSGDLTVGGDASITGSLSVSTDSEVAGTATAYQVTTTDLVVSGAVISNLIPDDEYSLGSSSSPWGSLIVNHARVNDMLSIPTAAPDTTSTYYDADDSYLWADDEGNYSESAGGGVASIGTLSIKRGSVTVGPYDLTEGNKTADISDLFSGYLTSVPEATSSAYGGIKLGNVSSTFLGMTNGVLYVDGDEVVSFINDNYGPYLTSDDLSGYATEEYVDTELESYQPLDADLTAIAGLTGTSGLLKKTISTGREGEEVTWSIDTSTYLTSVAFSDLTTHPTTLSGYGITDAKIETPSGTSNRKITLGSNNLTIYSWALASSKPSYNFSEIGSKPTTISGYGITDAIPYDGLLATINAHDSRKLWLYEVHNAFWAADKRYSVTMTGFASGNAAALFNGSFDDQCKINPEATGVITIAGIDGATMFGGGYPYGYIEVNFYSIAAPASVTCRVCKLVSGAESWTSITMSNVNRNGNTYATYRGQNTNVYGVTKIEITIVGQDNGTSYPYTAITEVCYYQTRGTLAQCAVFNKSIAQTLYHDLTAPKFIATATTGTAPLTISSTTLVSNLNADLLDGLHSYQQRRLGNAKDTLNTDAIAYGLDAEGTGTASTAVGYKAVASGAQAVALGRETTASAEGSAALRYKAQATGNYSTAIAYNAKAQGIGSWAGGHGSTASGDYSVTLGNSTTASGTASFAAGNAAVASGNYSTAIGRGAEAKASYAFASGYAAHALRDHSIAVGNASWAGVDSGDTTYPYALLAEYTPKALTYGSSTVYGIWNKYDSATSVTFTYSGTSYTVTWPSATPASWRVLNVVEITNQIHIPNTTDPWRKYYVRSNYGFSVGTNIIGQVTELTTGIYAIISNPVSTSDDTPTRLPMNSNAVRVALWKMQSSAVGNYAVATTSGATAPGSFSLATGSQSAASGSYSLATGCQAMALGNNSIAMGYFAVAYGTSSIALATNSTAASNYSVALGCWSEASSAYAIATGYYARAQHQNSFVSAAFGISGANYQTVLGVYNVQNSTDALILGWGDSSARKNIMTVSTAGVLNMASNILPMTTNTANLGSSTLKFKDIWSAGTIYADGAISVPTSTPSSPDSGRSYFWVDTTGNYAVMPTYAFNQLVENGDFSNGSTGWTPANTITISTSDGVATLTKSAANTANLTITANVSLTQGHTYYIHYSIKVTTSQSVNIRTGYLVSPTLWMDTSNIAVSTFSTWQERSYIKTVTGAQSKLVVGGYKSSGSNFAQYDTCQLKDIWITDLTEMYGAGNEPTVEQFEALYPQDYYDYTPLT